MDPNTLNLDPDLDPELWPNLDPNPDPGLCFERKKKKIILEKNIFSTRK